MRRLIYIILSLFITSTATAHNRNDICVALLTDLHVTPGNTNEQMLKKAVAELNSATYDLVIINGDLTNSGRNDELQNVHQILSHLRHRTLVTVGNHETTWSESGCTEFRRLWGHNGETSAKVGNYLFTAYPAGPYMKMADGGIPSETLLRLEGQMARAGNRKIVSVCHYPLNNDLTNRAEIRNIVRRHNVVASICGHYHEPRLMNLDSLPGILGRSLMLKRNGKETYGYTILRFSADSIHVAEKLIGKKEVAQYAVHQRRDERVSALPCDQEREPLDYGGLNVKMIIDEPASIYTNVALKDNIIFYGNSEGRVKAFDTERKQIVWERRFNGAIYSSPIIYNNLLIVATLSEGLWGLDAATGKTIWRNRTLKVIVGDGVISDTALYIGTSGKMYRINPQTGNIVWQFDYGEGQPQGRPTVEGNRIVFGAWNCHLYCLDTDSGKELWHWTNGNKNILFSPGHIVPRIAKGRVMIVAPDRHMTFLDLESGNEIWRIKRRRVRETTGLSDDGKTFYAKTMDGEMIAIPTLAEQYTEKWCGDAKWGYDHNFCPIVCSKGYAFMANRKGQVAIFDEKDGQLKGCAKLGNSSTNDFAIDLNGDVWLTLIEGKIYKITIQVNDQIF